MPAQQRRRRHDETVPTPRRKEASKRSDEGAIGRAKLRPRLLTRQHRQLVTKQHEFDVFGELGAPTPNEQPQNSGEAKIGEGEQHRAILPARATALPADCRLRRSAVSGIRARVNRWNAELAQWRPPGTAEVTLRRPEMPPRNRREPRSNLQSEF
jgi:hypothetical protein